jgi:hypothetical protein
MGTLRERALRKCYALRTVLAEFYIRVTAHRNKFLCNKTN